MNVLLSKHFEDFVESKVKSGRYQDAGEVIRAGLRLLEENEKPLAPMQLERELLKTVGKKPVPLSDEFVARIKRKGRALLQK